MNVRRARIHGWTLVAVGALVGAGWAIEHGRLPEPSAPANAGGAVEASPTAANPADARPFDEAASPPRAAAAAPAAAAPAAAPPAQLPAPAGVSNTQARGTRFELVGTSIVEGSGVAFIREIGGQRSWAVRRGDRIDDIVVLAIESERVRIGIGDHAEELMLVDSAGSVAATTVGPQAATVSDDARARHSTVMQAPATDAAVTPESMQVGHAESANGDEAAEAPSPPPPPRPVKAPPPAAGTVSTLNAANAPFDPYRRAGEPASGDEAISGSGQ